MGEWDEEVMLAEWYHWTPDQVGRMDPDFIDEIFARKRAEVEHQKRQEARAKRERKARQ